MPLIYKRGALLAWVCGLVANPRPSGVVLLWPSPYFDLPWACGLPLVGLR